MPGFVGGREACGNYPIVRPGKADEIIVTEMANHLFTAEGDELFFVQWRWRLGCPLERGPTMVLNNVQDDYVSLKGAAHDYGVVTEPATQAIDNVKTAALRKKLRQERAPNPHWLADGRREALRRTGLHPADKS